jgi:hypothetical protein
MPDRIWLLPNAGWVCLDREDRRVKIAIVNPGQIVSRDWRLPLVSGDTIIRAPASASDSSVQLHPSCSTVALG